MMYGLTDYGWATGTLLGPDVWMTWPIWLQVGMGTIVDCGGGTIIGTIGAFGAIGTWTGLGLGLGMHPVWRLAFLVPRAPRVTAEPEPQRQRTVGETWPVRYPVD